MRTPLELREEKGRLIAQSRQVLDAAEADGNRPLSAEERANIDALDSKIDELEAEAQSIETAIQATAERRQRQDRREEESRQTRPAQSPPNAHRPLRPDAANGGEGDDRRQSRRDTSDLARLRADGFNHFLVGGSALMSPTERAAMQVDNDTAGGTLVVPEEFVSQLIIFVNDLVFMRGISTVLPLTSADEVGIPSVEADPADADWTSEILIGGEDSTMATGKRRLHPNPLGKLLKVSRKLLRQSAIPAEQLIRERLGYKFAITEERAFLNGTGANQPLGVFTASAAGITTARDVSSGNTTTAVTADGLINCKFSLKSQYMASPSTRWIFNRTVVRDIRKLKDGNGQYLWQQGLGGTPDTILEVPYLMSEYAPNTMTTGLYVGIIGDFRWYYIAESLRMELQRLDELYAASNQVGFVGRMELDGMPVLAEAFARVTLA